MGVVLDDEGIDPERCKETKEVVAGKEFFRFSRRFLMRALGLAISASAIYNERDRKRESEGERKKGREGGRGEGKTEMDWLIDLLKTLQFAKFAHPF